FSRHGCRCRWFVARNCASHRISISPPQTRRRPTFRQTDLQRLSYPASSRRYRSHKGVGFPFCAAVLSSLLVIEGGEANARRWPRPDRGRQLHAGHAPTLRRSAHAIDLLGKPLSLPLLHLTGAHVRHGKVGRIDRRAELVVKIVVGEREAGADIH